MSGARAMKASVRSIAERNVLVEQWMGLPKHVVHKKLQGHPVIKSIGVDDAVSIGTLALIRAAELWEPDRNILFKTYAMQSIINRIFQERMSGNLIRVPNSFQSGPGKPQTPFLDLALKALNIKRLDTLGFKDRNEVNLEYPGERINKEELEEVMEAVRLLPSKYRYVLKRTMIDGEKLIVVGQEIGLVKERVRQIRNAALKHLKYVLGVGEKGGCREIEDGEG